MMQNITPLEIELLTVSMNATKTPITFESVVGDNDEIRKSINRLRTFGLLVTKDNVLSNKGLAYLVVYGNQSFYKIWQEHPNDFSVMAGEFNSKLQAFDKNSEWFDIYFYHYMKHHILDDLFDSVRYYAFTVARDLKAQRKFEVAILRRLLEDGRIPIENLFAMFGYDKESIKKQGVSKEAAMIMLQQIEKMI